MENLEPSELIKNSNSRLHTITPLSKYLATMLFVTLPFLGGWVGYTYSPEKIIEVEKTIIKTESFITKQNRFTENPEYFPVGEAQKTAYIVDIASTSITLDEVKVLGSEVVNEEIDPITYFLNDTPFLTSARGPVTLETIRTNPSRVSAPVNELKQPLAHIEFVTYENSSGVQTNVATVVKLSFTP